MQSHLVFIGEKSSQNRDIRNYVENLESKFQVQRIVVSGGNPNSDELKLIINKYGNLSYNEIHAIGGGKVLDIAKAFIYFGGSSFGDDPSTWSDKSNHNNITFTAIPTTAGSGSECTSFAVLYHSGLKYSLQSPKIKPSEIKYIPEVLASLDLNQLTTSYLDSLAQAIESCWSKGKSKESLIFSEESLRIHGSLLKSEWWLKDRVSIQEHYSDLFVAASLAGSAINITKTTAPHALSYYLTMHHGIKHGVAVAVLLGHFIQRALDNNSEDLKRVENILKMDGGEIKEVLNRLALFSDKFLSKKLSLITAKNLSHAVCSVNLERLNNHYENLTVNDLYEAYIDITKNHTV